MCRSLAMSSSVRFPWTSISASSASIWENSSSVRLMSAAPRFSWMRSSLREPGMGTMKSFLCSIHANEICAGVTPFLFAKSLIRSSRGWFARNPVEPEFQQTADGVFR